MSVNPTPTLPRPRSRWRSRALLGAVALAAIGAGYYFYAGDTQQAQQNRQAGAGGRARFGAEGPTPVLVAAAKTMDVPVTLDAVGTVRALNTVTVRAQVDGKLMSVDFKEGQDVKKGDVLARIDPTTYQAALDQAIAKKAQDAAVLANARVDLERYEKLAATNSINRQQADTQKSLVAQNEAIVNSDQAAIDNARAILQYTTIMAPLDGRTGIRQVDEGNIVRASDSTGVVVITQVKPISVLFNLPQQSLPQVNAAFAKVPLPVEALKSDDNSVIERGTLQVVDNQVDQTTGTVKLKAEFANESLTLWPGQFVNVRLTVDTLKQVTVIPTGAVQRGPNGTFVYVVTDDSKVTIRPIAVSRQDDVQAVITRGLQPGERAVTTGFSRLSEGAQVAVSTSDGTPQPAAPGQRRRNGGPEARETTPRDGATRRQRSEAASPATTQ